MSCRARLQRLAGLGRDAQARAAWARRPVGPAPPSQAGRGKSKASKFNAMDSQGKQKHTLLIVDDEALICKTMADFFTAGPFTVLTAGSAEEALGLLQRHSADVVLADEKMPGMSGSELLAVIRRQYPQTIRMMVTGKATLETAVRAINDGQIYRFFTKPCNMVAAPALLAASSINCRQDGAEQAFPPLQETRSWLVLICCVKKPSSPVRIFGSAGCFTISLHCT